MPLVPVWFAHSLPPLEPVAIRTHSDAVQLPFADEPQRADRVRIRVLRDVEQRGTRPAADRRQTINAAIGRQHGDLGQEAGVRRRAALVRIVEHEAGRGRPRRRRGVAVLRLPAASVTQASASWLVAARDRVDT